MSGEIAHRDATAFLGKYVLRQVFRERGVNVEPAFRVQERTKGGGMRLADGGKVEERVTRHWQTRRVKRPHPVEV